MLWTLIFLLFFSLSFISCQFQLTTCGCFSNQVVGGTNIRFCGEKCATACASAGTSCSVSPSSLSQIRWGECAAQSGGNDCAPELTSGLGFSGETNSIALGQEFVVGSLTHFNHPVQANTYATEVELTLTISIPAPYNVEETFSFPLEIDETRNEQLVFCPYPSTIACSDRIIYSFSLNAAKSFSINNVDYTLALTGFKTSRDASSSPINQFISEEGGDNTAYLFARVVGACSTTCTAPLEAGLVPGASGGDLTCACSCPVDLCSTPPYRIAIHENDPDTCGCRCKEFCPNGLRKSGIQCRCPLTAPPTGAPTAPLPTPESTTAAIIVDSSSEQNSQAEPSSTTTEEVSSSAAAAIVGDAPGDIEGMIPIIAGAAGGGVALLLLLLLLVICVSRRGGKATPTSARKRRPSRNIPVNDNPLYETANLNQFNPMYDDSRMSRSKRTSRSHSRAASRLASRTQLHVASAK